MRNKLHLCLTILFFILIFSTSANAQTITSTGTGGNWNATGTWVGGVVPGASNDVVIAAGATVTVTDARSCASIVIQTSTANATNTTLTINSSQQLTVSGTITIGNNVAMANGAVNTTSLTVNGTLVSGTITQNPSVRTGGQGGAGHTNLTISSTGNVQSSGDVNGTTTTGGIGAPGNGTASVIFTGAGSLSLTGSFTTSVFTNAAGSTVNYSGAAQTVREVAYNNLTLSGSGTKTLTNITTVNNNLSMSGSATATTSSAMTVSGNVLLSGTSTLTTGNTFNVTGNLVIGDGTTFTNAGHASTITGTTTVGGGTSGSLVINSATNTKTFVGLVTVASNGTWNNSGNSPVSFRGGLTNNGTFTAGSGVHTFETTAAQALTGTFSIPSISVSTGVTLTNNNTLTVSTSLAGAGGLTNASTGTLNISGTSDITTLTATASGNTVNYNGSAQTVKATTYHNLTLSNTGTKTAGGNLTVNGQINIASGVVLDMSTNSLSGASLTTTGTGTLRTQNISAAPIPSGKTWSMTVEYNSASAQTIVSGNYISLNGTGGDRTLSSSGTIGIAGTFTPGAGVFTITGSTVDYNGGTQTVAAITYNNLILSNSGAKTMTNVSTINGDLTVTGTASIVDNPDLSVSGTFTYSSSDATTLTATQITIAKFVQVDGTIEETDGAFEVSGTGEDVWVKSGGTFTGTVIFTGDNPQISGQLDNVMIDRGNTITLSDDVTVTGTLDLDLGNILIGANTLTLSGPINFTGGRISSSHDIPTNTSTSNLVIDGAGDVTGDLLIKGAKYINDVSILRSGTFNLGHELQVLGDLTLDGAALSMGTNFLHLHGNLNLSNGGTLVGGPNSYLLLKGTGNIAIPEITLQQFAIQRDNINNITFSGPVTILEHLRLYRGSLSTGGNLVLSETGNFWINKGQITGGITFGSSNNIYYESGGIPLNTGSELTNTNNIPLITVRSTNPLVIQDNVPTLQRMIIYPGSQVDVNGKDITISGYIEEMSGGLLFSSTGGGTVSNTKNIGKSATDLDVGGLGAIFTARKNLGRVTVTRGFAAQNVSGDQSLLRYYNISQNGNGNGNNYDLDFTFRYHDSELNGNDENLLKLWISTNSGVTWNPLGDGGSVNTANKTITVTNLTSIKGRITAKETPEGDGLIVEGNDQNRSDDNKEDNDKTRSGKTTDERKNQETTRGDRTEVTRSNDREIRSVEETETRSDEEIETTTIFEEIPSEVGLVQNYPNPFNPTTTIKFALPESDFVSVKVFDIMGREIAELVNGNMNAGFHTVQFDGSNLSSGLYFYKITTGSGFNQIMKMSLIK